MIETPVVDLTPVATGPASAGGPPRFFALFVTAGGTLLAGTCGRGISRSSEGATRWSPVVTPLVGANVNAFAPGEGRTVLVAAGVAGVLRSVDDGRSWTRLGPDGADVFAVRETVGTLVAGTGDGIAVCAAPGVWVPAVVGPVGTVFRLVPLAGDRLLAATERDGVWIGSVAAGWSQAATSDWPVYALAALPTGRLLAGTRGGGVRRSDDGGRSWIASNDGLPDPVVHAIISDVDGAVLAGTGRGIARSVDDGARWQRVDGELADHRIFALMVTGDGRLFAGSYEGVWSKGRDRRWRPVDTGLSVGESFTVTWRDDGVALAGVKGGACRSVDGGQTWQSPFGGMDAAATFDFCFTSTGDVLAGTDDGMWRVGSNAAEWSRAGLDGMRVFRIIEPEPGMLLAGTLGHGVQRGADGSGPAARWQPCSNGLPYRMVYDLLDSPRSGTILAAAGDVVGGIKTGGIYRSADRGETWTAAAHDPITVYRVRELSDGTMIAGAQRSCILRSGDGGATWTASRPQGLDDSKLYCLAVDADDRVYLGTGTRLLRSEDAGDCWQVIGDGLDGVTVYELSAHPGGVLLVSTSSGMFRSEDAGLTFRPVPWPVGSGADG